ncbi:MAG: hypothetical protein ACI8R1_002549, partial [Psychrobacter glaciei]
MINKKNHAYRQIHKPIIALLVCASSISVHAAIVSDNSERRIEVRQGGSIGNSSSNAYIRPSTNATSYNSGVTVLSGATRLSGANAIAGDSMQGLIQQKQRDFDFDASLSIEENKRVNVNRRTPSYNTTYPSTYSTSHNTYNNVTSIDFNGWLNSNSYRASQVADY